MDFHIHETLYEYIKHRFPAVRASVPEFYANTAKWTPEDTELRTHTTFLKQRARIECRWYKSMRPYYKVWPSITDSLSKLSLNKIGGNLELREWFIAIRFPKSAEPVCGAWKIKSILCGKLPCEITFDGVGLGSGKKSSGFAMSPLLVNRTTGYQPQGIASALPLSAEFSIGEWLCELRNKGHVRKGADDLTTIIEYCTKLALTVHLMADDPDIIKPDVLAKDRREYDRTGHQKYVDRAQRRGIVGWRLGEAYETCPHYRRPHFAIRHTGKGGTIPRIVPVKGAVVHRKKLTDVPTGYVTPDGVEVEP